MQDKPTRADEPPQPFAERRELPEALRIPGWLGAVLLSAMVAGVALALVVTAGPPAFVMIRAIFFAAAFAYLTISIVDFWEHGRLERLLGGSFFSTRALPLGESVNHALTTVAVVGFLLLARRPPAVLEWRDWVALSLPALFLLLGWRDELVYHRRRCAHREDIMHTVAHLAAGTMMCAFALSRMVF
jgi:hypothetical protein